MSVSDRECVGTLCCMKRSTVTAGSSVLQLSFTESQSQFKVRFPSAGYSVCGTVLLAAFGRSGCGYREVVAGRGGEVMGTSSSS